MAARVIIVMGVSGCGKTTLGKIIAANRHAVFIDGDDLHPKENVAKMQQGIPLEDADREGWFDRIIKEANTLSAGHQECVIACSALKKQYRDTLRAGIKQLTFVYLKVTYEQAYRQMLLRKEHYMPVALLKSQFETLEEPLPDEGNIETVILTKTLDENAAMVLDRLSSL